MILFEEDFPLVCPNPSKILSSFSLDAALTSLTEEMERSDRIESWVDDVLMYYSEQLTDRDIYFYSDYQLMEVILDSALSNAFYKGKNPLEVFLEHALPERVLAAGTLPFSQELIDSFNEKFKNEPNFS